MHTSVEPLAGTLSGHPQLDQRACVDPNAPRRINTPPGSDNWLPIRSSLIPRGHQFQGQDEALKSEVAAPRCADVVSRLITQSDISCRAYSLSIN